MHGPATYTRRSETSFARSLALILAAAGLAGCPRPTADLVPQLVVVPASAYPGDSLALENRVCNTGKRASLATEVQLLLQPFDLPAPAVLAGGRPLPPLAPGECDSEELWISIPSGLTDGAYEAVVVVDPMGLVPGPVANNTLVSDVFGIGYGPDLVVRELQGPPAAESGMSFSVTAKVCNQGTGPSGLANLTVYHSSDPEIDSIYAMPDPPGSPPAADWVAGFLSVPDIQAGGCSLIESSVQASVPTDGAYYLGAIVNDDASVVELVHSNNAFTGELMGVGYGPDLVWSSLVGPPSVQNGNSFEVHGTVCNQGTAPSDAAAASIYFSEDQNVSSGFPIPPGEDPLLGSFPLPSLPPGACHDADTWLVSNVPTEGAWYLAGVVDDYDEVTELLESNNSFVGALTGVGYGPDLVVSSIVAPPSVENGSSFDADVRVCNYGTADSGPAMLRLFLSEDGELDEGAPPVGMGLDHEAGNVEVGALSPGQCQDETVYAWAAAPTEGAYHLGARADVYDLEDELIESNNDLVGPLMGVGLGPDLVVTGVVAPASAERGAQFSGTVTVCNRGTQPSGPADVSLYHSIDLEVSGVFPGPPGEDWYAGNWPVPQVDPGACVTTAGEGWAGTDQDGAYYLLALVDEFLAVTELIETNNAFTGPQMGIGFAPDLVVTELDTPPSALPGSDVSLGFEVCNQGTTVSATSQAGFYLSVDAEIEGYTGNPFGADLYLGDTEVPPLEPAQCHAGNAIAHVPYGLEGTGAAEGERHIGVIADDFEQVAELIESNNTFSSVPVGVGTGPDLIVSRLSGPPSAQLGSGISVEADVCNQGTAASTMVSLGLYLTVDTSIEGSGALPPGNGDPLIGWVDVASLAPAACQTLTVLANATVPNEGAYYLAAIVDETDSLAELLEANNSLLGELVGIGTSPDLVINSLTSSLAAMQGTPFDVEAEVCNQGTSDALGSLVNVYHSEDDVISGISGATTPDWLAGSLAVPFLAAGQCATVSESMYANVPFDGAWVLGGIVDEFDSVHELVESNNGFAGPTMGVGFAPDLVITDLTGPPTAALGSLFALDFTVCNQGTVVSPAAELWVYHSPDDTIDGVSSLGPADPYLAGFTVPPLDAGVCHADTQDVWANVPETSPGYLAATIDEMQNIIELIETNNERLGAALEITP